MTTAIKLQTNIPLTGIVASVGYRQGLKGWVDKKKPGSPPKDLPDQIELIGSWENHGDGSVFLDTWAIAQLASIGLLSTIAGMDQYGKPQFKVLRQDRIQILKSENGTRKETSFTLVGQTTAASSGTQLNNERTMSPIPGVAGVLAVNTEDLDAKLVALYKDCWKEIFELQKVLGAEIAITESSAAACATIFIARSKLVVR